MAPHASHLSISDVSEYLDVVQNENDEGAATNAAPPIAPAGEQAPPPASDLAVVAPTLPAKPTEDDKDVWRTSASSDAEGLIEGDKRPLRIAAMGLVDYRLNGGEKSKAYFEGVLKPIGLTIAGDKPMMGAATAATRLDRGRTDTGRKAAKTLDKLASAMLTLDRLATKTGIIFAYDPACVKNLIALFDEVGGYDKAANLARPKLDAEGDPNGVFAIDIAEATARIRDRARRKLSALRGDFVRADGLPDVEVDRTAFEKAFAEGDLERGLGYRLWLLTQTAYIVHREETAKLVHVDDDPKGKMVDGKLVKPKKRFTEPHIISRANGSFMVSAHMARAGNVLHLERLGGVFDSHPGHDVMMPPQAHHKLALNLQTAVRRNVIDIEEGPASGTTTHIARKYRLRSAVATEPAYQTEGRGLSISWYLPTYDAASGNMVRDVRPAIEWQAVGQLALDAYGFLGQVAADADAFSALARKKRSQQLRVIDGRLEVTTDGKRFRHCGIERPRDAADLEVNVMSADLLAFFLYLGEQRFAEDKKLHLDIDPDRKALRWRFDMADAHFALFMPLATDQHVAFTDAFQDIAIDAPAPKPKQPGHKKP